MKKYVAVIIMSLIVMLGLFKGCNGVDYSEGDRVGVITKFSNVGYIWKTWEGDLSAIDNNEGDIWQFSIKDDNPNTNELVELIKEAMNARSVVNIHYHAKGALVGPWHSKTMFWIDSVSVLEDNYTIY